MRVLVTGAGSGIGAACLALLVDLGHEVIGADLDDARSAGLVALDVGDEAQWDTLMSRIGPIDGLVCSAGIRSRSLITETPVEEWNRHLRVNLTGTWLGIQAMLRQQGRSRSGAIVTISSVTETLAVPGQAHYIASKGGVAALTRAAALEAAPLGIRVNAIAPGSIDTPMAAERLADPEQIRWLQGRIPLGRVGEASEVAELAAFLLSDRAAYLTGEVIRLDGGWSVNAV